MHIVFIEYALNNSKSIPNHQQINSFILIFSLFPNNLIHHCFLFWNPMYRMVYAIQLSIHHHFHSVGVYDHQLLKQLLNSNCALTQVEIFYFTITQLYFVVASQYSFFMHFFLPYNISLMRHNVYLSISGFQKILNS